ncbi:hypothetical protein [Fibrobacter sp. UWEL]|uniref:hypothetical protein n=1 Tax=Fibrobacter sp. UWEL TaxID=1896209 RepID=UPI000917A522|nr:hypothetical protein [Fibrobacter sp. UWEL]SHL34306.1 hypothetical protein SAMN05720468_1232 [Fibrobacter sp. UWEL]
MIKVLGHDIRMTTEAEAILVERAKKGDKNAEKYLLNTYIKPVEDVHTFSAVGRYPSKLGHSYNFKGIDFEEHGEPLAQIHHHCIELYDVERKHKTAQLPYLKYLLDTISHRALDYLENEQRRTSHEIAMSDLKNSRSEMDWENMNNDDLMDVVACRELMHDNAAQERKDAEIEKLYDKAINNPDLTPGNRVYMQTYVKIAREKASSKGLMKATIKEMNGEEAKRNGGYHYEKKSREQLGQEYEDQFRAALGLTGE